MGEILLILLLSGVFALAVPIWAFLGWRRATQAQADLLQLTSDVLALRADISRLREAAAPKKAELPAEAALAKYFQTPAVAERAPPADTAPAVVEPVLSTALPEPEATSAEAMSETPVVAVPAPVVIEAVPPLSAASDPAPRDVEQTFATRWAIWIGGIALAFGGLLIVRYSIEAGFFGPGVRLLFGAAFAIALGVASDVIRRRDLRFAALDLPTEQVPAILAGVSVLSGFGVVYAAHALYGFLDAGPAFAAMGGLGLGALALSLLHGPYFGLFGLAGSYVTPLLVASAAPNIPALAIFIAVVTAAAFLIERLRPSALLLAGAITGHAIWVAAIAFTGGREIWVSFLLVIAVLVALIRLEFRAPHAAVETAAPDPLVPLAAFAVPLILGGVLWVEQGGGPLTRFAFALVAAGCFVAAIRHAGHALLAPLAAAAATGFVLLWPDVEGAMRATPSIILDIIRLNLPPRAAPGLAPFAVLLAVMASSLPFAALLRRWRNGGASDLDRGALAFASALAPVCILLACSLRLNGFERSPTFAVMAAGLVAILAVASERLFRQESRVAADEPRPFPLVGSAAYAAAAAIALGLAIAFALRETWLVVGFAVAGSGVATVQRYRPVPLLRAMAAALGTAALARVFWSPVLSGVGEWPILNWLAVVYGVPALVFGWGAAMLSGRRDRARGVLEGLCAFFLSAFVLLSVVQAFFGGDLLQVFAVLGKGPRAPSLAIVTGLFTLAGLALALLALFFARLGREAESPVFEAAGKTALAGLMLVAFGGLALLANPLAVDRPAFEPMILNSFLFGHVGLGVLLVLLARLGGGRREGDAVRPALMAIGGALGVIGLALIIRHAFHGPTLHSPVFMTLAEAGLYGALALLIAAATDRLELGDEMRPAVAIVAVAIWGGAFFAAGGGHAPLSGWFILNNAAIGLALPALIAGLYSAWLYRRNADVLVARIHGVAAVVGGLLYALQQVRFLFPGSDWLGQSDHAGDPMRLFGYSFAIIGYGILLLVGGLRLNHRDLRLAALAVMALAAFKVFLLDLAGLGGLWRAASFIGLGGSLIGIAYLYRWLLPPAPRPAG